MSTEARNNTLCIRRSLLPGTKGAAAAEDETQEARSSFSADIASRQRRLLVQRSAAEIENLAWFEAQKLTFPNFKPSANDQIIFDVGFNDGSDTAHYLKGGFHVVGLDANAALIEDGMERFKDAIAAGKLALVTAGIEEGHTMGNLTFWRAKHNAQSSFEKDKACQEWWGGCEPVQIPVRQCQGMWAFGKPFYVKIDIEERHYCCVNALRYVSPELRPEFISWEMHEFAKGQPYPMMDAQLILNLWRLGYSEVKLIDNGGNNEGTFSGSLPADAIDWTTQSTSWRRTQDLIEGGLPDARKVLEHADHFHWWDFHMRRASPDLDREDWS